MKTLLTDAFALVGEGCSETNSQSCERTLACADCGAVALLKPENERLFVPFCKEATLGGATGIYLPTLDLPDKTLDSLIEYALDTGAELAVKCGCTLTDTGIIDARFGKSPVMLLYEFGLLQQSRIISGVCLDKDDLSLMAQEGVPLAVLPSTDAGEGNGVAPVCAALNAGVKLRIGTGSGVYNPKRSVIFEAAFLRLAVSAQMNKKDAVSVRELAKMCALDGADDASIKQIEREITDY